MDKATVDRIKLIHPKLRSEVELIYKEICDSLYGKFLCRFAYTLRSFKEQDDLYAIGRTVKGKIVTNAKGGQSYHNYGMAIDIVMVLDKDGNGTYETASWDTKLDFDGDGKRSFLYLNDTDGPGEAIGSSLMRRTLKKPLAIQL